jgi:hypothetical protein
MMPPEFNMGHLPVGESQEIATCKGTLSSDRALEAKSRWAGWLRQPAPWALILFVTTAGYALVVAIGRTLHVWTSDPVYQPARAILVRHRGSLGICLAGVLALAVLTGLFWRAGWLRAGEGRWRWARGTLLATVWLGMFGFAGQQWQRLALQSVLCDGVLIASVMLVLGLAYAGVYLGAGTRRFSTLGDHVGLAAVGVVWLAIAFQANQLAAVLAVGSTLAVAAVAGFALLRTLGRPSNMDWLDTLLFSLGLGLGALALATLLLGHLHLLYWWLAVPAYGVVLYAGYRRFGAEIKGFAADIGGLATQACLASHWSWSLLALLLAVVLSMTLIGNLGPEVCGDAIMGRLSAPAMYVRAHHVEPCPYIMYTYSTCGGEMVTTLPMVLGGRENAGKLINFAIGIAGLATLFAFGRRWQDWRAGLIAVFAMASSSVIWWLLTSAYTDLTFLFYGMLASYALYCWLENGDRSWLVVSALLAGFAAGVKMTGGFLICPAVLLVVLVSWRRGGSLRAAKPYLDGLLYAACAAVGIGPWLVRTYCYTGNPIFPFLITTFDPSWPAWMQFGYHFRVGSGLLDYLRIADRAVFNPAKLIEMGRHSPLSLALLPALAGLAIVRRCQLWFAGYVAVIAMLWVVTDVNLRYGLLQVALIYLVAAGILVKSWDLCRPLLRRASQIALGLVVASGVLYVLICDDLMRGPDGVVLAYKPWLGAVAPEAHLASRLGAYPVVAYVNRTYGEKARLWSTIYQDSLWLKSDSVAWLWMGKQQALATLLNDATPVEDAHRGLTGLGITHLLCRADLLRSGSDGFWTAGVMTPAFLERSGYCELEFAARGHYLFRVAAAEKAVEKRRQSENLLANPQFHFVEGRLPGWEIVGKPLVRAKGGMGENGSPVRVDLASYVQQTVAVSEGGLYRLSVTARAAGPHRELTLEWWWRDGREAILRPAWSDSLAAPAAGWEIVSYETAPLGARSLMVKVLGAHPEDKVWVQDVKLVRLD